MSTLCFHIQIGEEDGPCFSYHLTKNKPESHIIITCWDDDDYPTTLDSMDHITLNGDLKEILNSNNIEYIYEIHDWADYKINKKDMLTRLTHKIEPVDKNLVYDLYTYNRYATILQKFLVPKDMNISFSEKSPPPNKYMVNMSYSDILNFYKIDHHYIYCIDEDEEDEDY